MMVNHKSSAASVDRLFSLENKVVLITGAGSGFGAHFAKTLSAAGAAIVCAARRRERIEAVAQEVISAGGAALPVVMDVTDRDSVERGFEQAERSLGTIDVIINNAGHSEAAHVRDMSESQWDNVLNVNLKGTWRVSQVGARRLIEAGKPGSIINVSSILGLVARPAFSNYATSKAAIIHLTRSLALDLIEFNIRVNALAPGFFRTEMTDWWFQTEAGRQEIASLPVGRLGEMSDLNGPLLLLASDASNYMSGSVLTVDAAHTVRIS